VERGQAGIEQPGQCEEAKDVPIKEGGVAAGGSNVGIDVGGVRAKHCCGGIDE
jgi:hypothetical protein